MKKIIFILYITFNSIMIAQTIDTLGTDSFYFKPSFAGGQFEVTTIIAVSEFGALFDIDLLKMNKVKSINSFGIRFGFESYGYLEPGGPTGGGPFKDYCFYLFHSARSKNLHFNLMGGLAYHTKRNTFYEPDNIKLRVGAEFRYNLLEKMAGIILKGATSFDKRTTYVGLGIAFGFYK